MKLPISATMIVPSASAVAVDSATIIKAVWAQIGVNVTISQLSLGDFTTKYTAGKYQLATNVEAPRVSAGFSLPLVAVCSNPFNNAHVCVPGVDHLIEKGRAEMNSKQAQPIWDEVTTKWRAAWPRIPLFQINETDVLSKKVSSFTTGPVYDFASWQLSS